ncbi:PREDICTED: uncharacterized protein LOC106749947, partial [Dinoponera quadriceps]|uniref:Uncharacterized protein LOC106749947 n=1 Tax=Dinoponera quadriceps TaxID=609295 RepID=A0A6P3Y513_DINQU
MEFSWDRYHNVTKRLSSVIGVWPYQNKKEKVFRLSVTILAAIAMIIPQTCKFYHCDKDLECIFGTIPSYILVIGIMLKLHTCSWKANKIKTLTDHMFSDWERLQDPQEYEIMETYVASARRIIVIYIWLCLPSMTIFVLVSLIPRILDIVLPLNESRPIVLPFEAYYFVDEREYFFYIFFQGAIIADIAIMGLIVHDAMFMTFVEHVCGVFAVAG